MLYRAVGNRCCIDLQRSGILLQNNILPDEAEVILQKLGFKILILSTTPIARSCLGRSRYQHGALPDQAPGVVNCSSFVKWIFAQMGIWIPRLSIDQRDAGAPLASHEMRPGDLVFSTGRFSRYREDPSDDVGHVGILVGDGNVVHAANAERGVVENSVSTFCTPENFRGACRLFAPGCLVLEIPPDRCVETSDDVVWAILEQRYKTAAIGLSCSTQRP